MRSQVTTKTGDDGSTRILAGDRVPKDDPIVEATGALDSLRAELALLRLEILENDGGGAHEPEAAFLWWLLHACFLIGAEVSDPLKKHPKWRQGEIGPKHLAHLEEEQARVEALTPLPRSFIVSAANRAAARADLAATTARTFERRLVTLKRAVPEFPADHLLRFTNRLSDYLFMLARRLDGDTHLPVDYAVLLL